MTRTEKMYLVVFIGFVALSCVGILTEAPKTELLIQLGGAVFFGAAFVLLEGWKS